MSILAGLFGPSVDALKRKKDHEGLWELRHHKSWPMRRDAALALAELSDERGVIYFLAAQHADEPEICAALIKAVARDAKLATAVVRLAQAGGYSHAIDRVFLVLETYRPRISAETLVDDLIDSREGPFWWSRTQLRRMLLPFGNRVIKRLIDHLEEPHKARKAAPLVGALGRGAGTAAPVLVEAFKENPALQTEIQSALLELYDTGLDALLAALDDPDESVRALAAKVLSLLPGHSRHRKGEQPVGVGEELAIQELIQLTCAQAVERVKADPNETVRNSVSS